MTNKQSFKILADKMDERERPLEIIRELKAAGIQIPEKYKHLESMAERKHWRRDPKIIEAVKKAARRAARNERAEERQVNKKANKISGRNSEFTKERPSPPPAPPRAIRHSSGDYTHERAEPLGDPPVSR